jgi:DNA invertase Pin-like site-specific DNA recombinase
MKKPNLTEAKPWTLLRNTHGDQKLIGYARVSTREQNLDAQLLRLRELKCCRIYAEKVSGHKGARPGWEALLSELRAGDVVCVLRIDRMGRKLSELVRSVETIRDHGAHVRSVEESIDTSQRGGRFAFDMVSVFAQKVRDDISENTRAGLAAAKLRGRVLGRPRKLEKAKIAHVAHLRAQGFSLREIGRATNLGKTTVETALKLAAALRGDPRQLPLTGTEATP